MVSILKFSLCVSVFICVCSCFAMGNRKGKKRVLLVDADVALTAPSGLDVDDDLAVIYGHKAKEVKIISLTTTFGNAPADQTCQAAKRLTKRINGTWNVACGSSRMHCFKADRNNEAVKQLINVTLSQPDDTEVTWVSQGSLHNIAGALYHGGSTLVNRIDRLVIMGGNMNMPELNTLVDPMATKYVLEYRSLKRIVVTIQVCMWAVIQLERDLSRLEKEKCNGSYANDHINKLKSHALKNALVNDKIYGPSPLGNQSKLGFYPWDVVAMSAAIDKFKYFSNIQCQSLTINPLTRRLVATKVECGHPSASVVPYKFQEYPFVDDLISRLCHDGQQSQFENKLIYLDSKRDVTSSTT